MKIELGDHPLRLAELVPLLAVIPDSFEPGKVSCREGCAACCRQLVPVSPPEAFYLASLVTPEIEARFDDARDRLNTSPLAARSTHPRSARPARSRSRSPIRVFASTARSS